MKKLILLMLVLAVCTVTCKKKQQTSVKYCPLITDTNTGHLVDLTPVSWIKEIMDTLNKYPQLQAAKVNFMWGHDSGSYYGRVLCNVFYHGLQIFNLIYDVRAMYPPPSQEYIDAFRSQPIPSKINISLDPAIDLERANQIARETVRFEHCTLSKLGISNKGNDSIPDYKLVWYISEVETGYPYVELDAQTGDVYRYYDNILSF